MEAKDTVMSFDRIQEIDLKNAESNFTDALWDVAREQALISFKAGIKEVVEWVEANLQYPTRGEGLVLKRNMEWQSQLKEWKITPKGEEG